MQESTTNLERERALNLARSWVSFGWHCEQDATRTHDEYWRDVATIRAESHFAHAFQLLLSVLRYNYQDAQDFISGWRYELDSRVES